MMTKRVVIEIECRGGIQKNKTRLSAKDEEKTCAFVSLDISLVLALLQLCTAICYLYTHFRIVAFSIFCLLFLFLFLIVTNFLVFLPSSSLARGGAKPYGSASTASFQFATVTTLRDTAHSTL